MISLGEKRREEMKVKVSFLGRRRGEERVELIRPLAFPCPMQDCFRKPGFPLKLFARARPKLKRMVKAEDSAEEKSLWSVVLFER